MRNYVAEALGSAFLLAVVVGSGIMGENLAAGNTAIALLANALATGAGLIALIATFGPISGAHFNPAVSLAMAIRGHLPWPRLPGYIISQVIGAILGVIAAHAMFDLPLISHSTHARTGISQWWSEFIATFGLLTIIWSGIHHHPRWVPLLVAAYITAAYWFTASTSFANPAVTFARALTDTFAGIRAEDVLGFVIAQITSALAATGLCGWLMAPQPQDTG